jgi:hypothetical protein
MAEKVRNHQKPLSPHQQWLQTWKEFEQDFSELPDWTQKIILQDINTAFKNRIATMQKVNQKNTNKKAGINPANNMQVLVQSFEGEN